MTHAQAFRFERTKLAGEIADRLTGDAALGASPVVFLAGPRRTGKSHFLKHDLVPQLVSRNILPVYVDLWSKRDEDPGKLIADAIKQAHRDADGLGRKAVRAIGLSKIGVGSWVSLDIDKIGATNGVTLADALKALLEKTGKRIALIVDEAQHALVSDGGMTAMYALKAARDELNMREDAGDGPNLMLVFTGSHRDKLSTLVFKKQQPFFGSTITTFPLLGRDYVEAYTQWINARLAESNRFDPADVLKAFELIGHRPEHLERLLQDMALGLGNAAHIKDTLATKAGLLRDRVWDEHARAYDAMSPLQKEVLAELINRGEDFAPFAAASLSAWSERLGKPVDASAVQTAIVALRDQGILWKTDRGRYALEEQDMAEWFRAKTAAEALPTPAPRPVR